MSTSSSCFCSTGFRWEQSFWAMSGRFFFSYLVSNILTMRWVANSVLLGSWFFARELLKPSAYLLNVGNLLMLCIGSLMIYMVITLAIKSKIIHIASMGLVPIMRSKAGFSNVSSHSTIPGCMLTNLLLLYWKNLTWNLPFLFMWKISFDVFHYFGICLVR